MIDDLARHETPEADVIDFEGLSVLCIVDRTEAMRPLQAAFSEVSGLNTSFILSNAKLDSVAGTDAVFIQAGNESEAHARILSIRSGIARFGGRLIVMMPAPTHAATARLVEAGADDLLVSTPSSSDILTALVRARAARRAVQPVAPANENRADSKTIVFLHASGGVGATTLAVNSALLLHQQSAGSGGVCLLDLDLQFGDAHLQLDIQSHSGISEFISAPDRLDQRMLQELMVDGPGGLKVLTCGASPLPLDGLTPEGVEAMLKLARRQYRHVVVDMPVALSRWTGAALRMADTIFLVTQLNVASVRAAKRLLDMLVENGVDLQRVSVIANRAGGKPAAPALSVAQAAKALDRDVEFLVPNDYAPVIESLDQGAPLAISRPGSKIVRALSDMIANKVAGEAVAKKAGGVIFGFPLQGRR